MNQYQINKKKAKLAAKVAVVETKPAPVAKEAKPNAVKDFIKSITPEQAPNAIKPSDFLPKKKKVEDK
jgi:hypothetical protein